jgi:UDP-N-acetylmuramoyl-tripeptide--D-alanyl-D-alanine ligase
VLSGDDPVTRAMAGRARCRTLFVGESRDNTLQATDVVVHCDSLSFTVDGDQYSVPVMGRHHLTNALMAMAIAREFGMTPTLIQSGFAQFTPCPGRGQMLTIGPWHVIDDTYNASPTAMVAALQMLVNLPLPAGSRRFAVFGDMLELGNSTEAEHCALGQLAGALRLDGVLACGAAAMHVARGALSAGLPAGRLVASSQLEVLLAVLDCWLEPGDVVLVKGSRSMKMERVLGWMRQQADTITCKSVLNCA